MKIYHKLVRDKIPYIIANSGSKPKTRILNNDEYLVYLKLKLQEELDEYLDSNKLIELADLLEVIYAIIEHNGISIEEFEKIRLTKRKNKGGFSKKIKLERVEDW